MAIGTITFEQKPISGTVELPVITNWTPIIPYAVKQTSIVDLFYFKFILEIRLTGAAGTLLGKIKQKQNPYETGTANVTAVFDIRDIVNTQLSTQVVDYNAVKNTIHTLGENDAAKIFSLNTSQLITVYVKAYQQFSESATASPSEDTSSTVNSTLFYTPASLDLNVTRGTTRLQLDAFDAYQLNSSVKQLLTDVNKSYNERAILTAPITNVYRNYVRTTDYHTVGFLNGEDDFDCQAWYWEIIYYSKPGSVTGTHELVNDASNGGAKPISSGTEVNADTERLIYFGCGPANLEASTVTPAGGSSGDAKPSNNGSWTYYTIQGLNASSGTPKTDAYYFIKDDDNCKGFEIRRLAWRNSLGCWDYFNFKMKSTQTLKIDRDSYEAMMGEFSQDVYSYNNFEGGKKIRRTAAILSETINTDWITEEEAVFLENLMKATKVQLIENDYTTYTVPVLIKDTNFVKKTDVNNRLKIQYTFKIEYANPINTNS
mgnify:CR=1 FL=1